MLKVRANCLQKVLTVRVLTCVILAVALACSVHAQNAEAKKVLPRWKWSRGDTFAYQLRGDVVSPGAEVERSLVSSTVTISAKDDRLAVFTNVYTEMKQYEKGVWYNATEEGLKEQSLSFEMDKAGAVAGEDKDAVRQRQEFLRALMPLPGEAVAEKAAWFVSLAGADMHGTVRFAGYGTRADRDCAVFKMELASTEKADKQPARELSATCYFDLEEGCFVYVERRIQTRGDTRKDEKLTLELVSSPKHQSAVEKEQLVIGKLQERLERDPKNTSVMRRLSDHYARLGKLPEALNMIDGILQAEPDNLGTLTRKGELLLAAGNSHDALKHFALVLEKDKTSSGALLGAANACFQLQRFSDCARYARAALGEEGKGPYQAYYLLGSTLAKMGKRDLAEKALQRYIELNPNIDKTDKPVIGFTKENDVKIVVKRNAPGVDVQKRLKYSPQELAEGRELIKALVREESVRLRLSAEEIEILLDHLAELYGKKAPEMIADFMADRDKTYEVVKKGLETQSRLPQEAIRKLAKGREDNPAAMEAVLSMLDPAEAVGILEKLVQSHAGEARYHYLLGRYYISNPKEYGRKALKRFELAAMLDEKNALYRYATAFACLKLHNQKRALDELSARNFAVGAPDSQRAGIARERLSVLAGLDFNSRIRKVTAWTLDTQFEARIMKELLDTILGIAKRFRKDKLYSAGMALAEFVYLMTQRLEESAASALVLVSARSARESAAGLIVGLCRDAGADPEEPDRDKYTKELGSWRMKLAEIEEQNLDYLQAYVEFLKKCERAFQVQPYTEPSEADRFIERLLEGEVSLFKEELAGVIKNRQPAKQGPKKEEGRGTDK
jgi:tetratricopeptide (TPR) repeat protein